VVELERDGDGPPIVCVHGLGGDILGFVGLAASLKEQGPVIALRGSGVVGEMPPFRKLTDIASHYIDELAKAGIRSPFHLIGYSAGAVIAFEMAQQLAGRNTPAASLTILDEPVPGSYYDSVWRAWCHPLQLLRDLSWRAKDATLKAGNAAMDVLRDSFASQEVRMTSQRTVTFPSLEDLGASALSSSYGRARLKFMAGLMEAVLTYRPKPYGGSVLLLRACLQPLACSHDPAMGWRKLAADDLDIVAIPGDHHQLLKGVRAEEVAGMIIRYAIRRKA
jgi:thioesterase domain-containing protein